MSEPSRQYHQALSANRKLLAEIARLKAEVEKVGAENAHLHKGIYSLSLNVVQLKDEVERLTKAGDAMASSIQFNEEMAKDYNGPTIVHQSVKRWNTAKEGKTQP